MEALRNWIKQNRPDLHERLIGKPLNECRVILNEVTGLNELGTTLIGQSCARYLERLKRIM